MLLLITPSHMSNFAPLYAFLPEKEQEQYAQNLPQGHTFIWRYWIDYIVRQKTFERSPTTTRSVRDALRMLVRETGLVSIEEINDRDKIQTALLKIKEKRNFSPSTYNSYLKNIKSYLIFLKKKGIIQEVQLNGVEKFKNILRDQFVPNDIQVQQIIAKLSMRRQTTLERLRNVFFYKLLLLTGARPSELELLTLDSIKRGPGQWMLTVQGTKNHPRNRHYPIPSSVKDSYIAYMLYRQQLGRSENNLFVSQSKRTGWTSKGMRGLLKKLSKELGFTVGLYSTRRYVATKLATSGATLQEIGDHLGHSRPSTTKRYIQQSGALTRKNVAILTSLLENNLNNQACPS